MNFANADVQAGGTCSTALASTAPARACHNNAGANTAAGLNRNFNTNTENPHSRPAGHGTAASARSRPPVAVASATGASTRTSVIEAADTAPFFHNNSAQTIEEAVHFYTHNDLLGQSVPAGRYPGRSGRSADACAQRSGEHPQQQRARGAGAAPAAPGAADDHGAGHSRHPGRDRGAEPWAAELYPDAVALLDEALGLENDARGTAQRTDRNALLQQAVALKEQARDLILQ